MPTLTKNQKHVFDFIKQYEARKGYAPSLQEIRKHFKLASVSTAHHYVMKLQDAGYLDKESHQPRGISIAAKDIPQVAEESPFLAEFGFDSILIPLIGSANCGPAEILAEENIEGYVKVSKKTVSKKDGIFAVTAFGNSMNLANVGGKSIEEGDYVIIDGTETKPHDGDYVLSIIDGAANLKKFKVDDRKNAIMLISESSDNSFKPIYIHAEDDFMINGKVIEVLKRKTI